LHLPPLRQRGEDILLLARHFLSKYASAFGKNVTDFSDEAARQLLVHDWPGNVRELENAVERAVILAQEQIIRLPDLILSGSNAGNESPRSFNEMKREIVTKFERSYIRDVLSAAKGNVTRAAQAAKKNRRAFLELMRKHGIDKASVAGIVPFLVDCLASVLP
jgi:two-component system response regulator GlrR